MPKKTTKNVKKTNNKVKEEPIAVKFFDAQEEIVKYIKLNHYETGHTTSPKFLFKKSDGTYIYRINYFNNEGVIAKSKFITALVSNDTVAII